MRYFLVIITTSIFLFTSAYAERVTPKQSVINFTWVRIQPSADSDEIGRLNAGRSLEYVKSVPNWYEVKLTNGQIGYVSKRSSEVIPDPSNVIEQSSFAVHFLDVGTGDSAIIDIGDKEIIIDGGDSIRVLNAYAERTGIIDDPIELVVVTHGDTDHWKGLSRLLGFDGTVDNPYSVLEYWDAGYNRDCNPADDNGRNNYLAFVNNVKGIVPATKFLRPLQNHKVPANVSGIPQPFALASIPGVTITVLHSDSNPTSGSCSYKINNASIVLKIEIDDTSFLFTGDANGKERDEASPGTPGHVEESLITLDNNHPGTLKADVLKVPHHGSETASTQEFIDRVNPDYAIISASTKHHLPKSTVLTRYTNSDRVILKTDDNRKNDNDHIVCIKSTEGLNCNFADVLTNN